jgi:hypothetical protein
VFIKSARKPTKEMIDFLSTPDLKRSVQALIRRDTDSLRFRVGEVALYFRPQSAEEAKSAIETLPSFLLGAFRPQPERWDLTGIPREFQHLTPLIKKWAESDDDLRSELINEAGEPSLRELVETVAPLFDSIKTYLDTFDDDLTEAAVALQTLAESTVEARIALKDSGDRN